MEEHTAPTSPDGPRIAREKRTISAMLAIYCHDHHGGGRLCADCRTLREYAHRRLEVCPFHEDKPACNHCPVHCYSATRREQVRAVMRYAGPRMLLRHPLLAARHLLDTRRRAPERKARRPQG
jgi:hypothetical protein